VVPTIEVERLLDVGENVRQLMQFPLVGEPDENSYITSGVAWMDKKGYDSAIKDFDEAIRLDPEFAFSYYCRGWAWTEKKNYDQAIRDYSEGIRLDPNDACNYFGRGIVWEKRRDFD